MCKQQVTGKQWCFLYSSALSSINPLRLTCKKPWHCVARIVLRARKHDRATPLLKELHWLPVERRISYKVALIVYKCMHNIAPEYLISLLSMPHRSNYSLRSSKDTLYLNIPRVDSKKGEASFDFCGPKTWNNLPYELRSSISIESFKKNLKTYLFSL